MCEIGKYCDFMKYWNFYVRKSQLQLPWLQNKVMYPYTKVQYQCIRVQYPVTTLQYPAINVQYPYIKLQFLVLGCSVTKNVSFKKVEQIAHMSETRLVGYTISRHLHKSPKTSINRHFFRKFLNVSTHVEKCG